MTSSPIRDEQGVVIGIVTESIDLTERKRAEAERMQLTHHLGERIKELTALHGVAQVLHAGNPLPKTLEGVAAILQAAWQYPELTGVCISFDSVEYQTPNYRQTLWKQESVVLTSDGRPSRLEIAYLEERPEENEGPFLEEERHLLNSVASMLASYFERRDAGIAVRESEARFGAIFASAGIGITILNLESQVIETSSEFQRILGYTVDELQGMSLAEFTHLEDVAADRKRFQSLTSGKRDHFQMERRFLRKDGRTAWGF